MQLQSQIESISVPQEFTRLYNAVLTMQYGDDYLAIDDDQADGGNDGYLKSEKRIFAGHCFKRIQKQKINDEILKKMSSDLSKAIELRDEGRWDIQGWTFLCNYSISEEVGAAILKQGKQAGLDISWRSADYFATALRKFQDVREQFPNLIATDIQATLDMILSKLEEPDSDRVPITRVPDNAIDQERLLIEKPPYWEYFYFGSILLIGKEGLELKWKDHTMHHARPSGISYSESGAVEYFRDVLSQLSKVTSGLMIAFEPQNMERAFGKPGESGDSILIKHLATHVVNAYEDILNWAYRTRAATYPDKFDNVAEFCAEIADRPASEVKGFIDDYIEQTNRVYPHLNGPNKNDPLMLEVQLVLTADQQAIDRYIHEYKKAMR